MMPKAWSSIEEVPYCFTRSSVKFLGHTSCKIDDSNPIWVRLLGRSQLSNPSDLPCSFSSTFTMENAFASLQWHDCCWQGDVKRQSNMLSIISSLNIQALVLDGLRLLVFKTCSCAGYTSYVCISFSRDVFYDVRHKVMYCLPRKHDGVSLNRHHQHIGRWLTRQVSA